MKLAIAWFTVLALCVVVSCSVSHRSGDYTCTRQSDCATPRLCEQGFCVVPDGVPIDGPPGGKDGKHDVCPNICSSGDLIAGTCMIDGGAGANCSSAVVCPPGFDCTIDCGTNGACRNGVDCR